MRYLTLIPLICLTGCSALQPTNRVERQFNFIDYDSPALRLAKPVTAELLEKDAAGSWHNIGTGEIPAGAYIKGRKPVPTISVTDP